MEIDGILYERAELGVDGNAAFALLGPNIQAGEAEFVEIADPTDDRLAAACAKIALNKLRERLGNPNLSYYLGRSHPMHC